MIFKMVNQILKKIQRFFSYIYLRYLLVTELYMVEPWEKLVIHIVVGTLFALFWYFNYLVFTNRIDTPDDSIIYTEGIIRRL